MKTNHVIALLLAFALSGGVYVLTQKKQQPTETSQEEAEGDSTMISKESAEIAGIETAKAESATIRETLTLTGRIALNQNKTTQVKARFPGIVREVRKAPGDRVEKDEVLCVVESNTSLQLYPVKSPIGGVVLARDASVGSLASDTSLFTVSDMRTVWAEFHVFPRDISRIQPNQTVNVTSLEGDLMGEAPITSLLPVTEVSSQTVVARVTLENLKGAWRAGMTVRGDVVLHEKQVPLAVYSSALQRMKGKHVVFVQKGERYEMRPVEIGISDRTWTEITSGLTPGEIYVKEKSFQIKADIGKSSAEHEH